MLLLIALLTLVLAAVALVCDEDTRGALIRLYWRSRERLGLSSRKAGGGAGILASRAGPAVHGTSRGASGADLPGDFRFDIGGARPAPAAVSGVAAAVTARQRPNGVRANRVVASAPARPTEDLDFDDVRELLRSGQGEFVKSRLKLCDCTVQSAFSSWGRCQRKGGASFVFHGKSLDGEDVSAKVYIPVRRAKMMTPHDLGAVDTKLRLLPPEAAAMFVSSQFLREEFELRSDVAGRRASHRLDVAVMPRLGGADARLLDTFVTDFRRSPQMLAGAARALRSVWFECARHGLAHGDLCAWNIVILGSAPGGAGLRTVLLDTDSLSWAGHLTVATRLRGQPGYNTAGRFKDAARFAQICRDEVHTIDLPSQLIIYLSILAYARDPWGAADLPVPEEGTLAFAKEDAVAPTQFRARLQSFRTILGAQDAENAAVRTLIDDLLAHCESPDGIDRTRPSPFLDTVISAGLSHYEARL